MNNIKMQECGLNDSKTEEKYLLDLYYNSNSVTREVSPENSPGWILVILFEYRYLTLK